MFDALTLTLASAVASGGTFTANYPDNRDAGHYLDGAGHYLIAMGAKFSAPGDISLSFGTSSITVTYNGSTTIPAGTQVWLHLARLGDDDRNVDNIDALPRVNLAPVVHINLGAPDTADTNGVCESQSIGSAGSLTLDGALVDDGEAVFDVPRNVVVDSGGADTATLTITGEDEYGNTMVEDIQLNGSTAVEGAKAFKKVTAVEADGTISNGAFVGTADVLGLPVALPDTGFVLVETEDNQAVGTGGTIVAADASDPTATTGDVRGTVSPNTTPDGSTQFGIIAALPDPTYKGLAQYSG